MRLDVRQLQLWHYRNLIDLRLKLANNLPVVWLGDNGVGKTNVLEAMSWLSPLRAMRGAKVSDISPHHQPPTAWRVKVQLQRQDGVVDLVAMHEVRAVGAGGDMLSDKRSVYVDDKALSPLMKIHDYIRLFWLTPQHDRLFQDGRSERCAFFDRLLWHHQPQHAVEVSQYDRLMKQRQSVFQQAHEQPMDGSWLDGLERQMAVLAAALTRRRQQFAAAINERATTLTAPLRAFSLHHVAAVDVAEDGRDVEVWLQRFHAARARDQASGQTTTGAHRSDWHATIQGQMPAHSASTGEQKLVVLGALLCAVEQLPPDAQMRSLVMIDEVAAHLDQHTRLALLEHILQQHFQVWLTGQDVRHFEPLKNQLQAMQIQDAKATQLW